MMAAVLASPQQVNLYNPALLPRRERFSARQLAAWILLIALVLGTVAWWAISQSRMLQREMAQQAARPAATPPIEAAATQQQVAALEKTLRERTALLETRRAVRDASKRGIAGRDSGPSGVLRQIADTIPASAWLTEVRVAGSRIDVKGRALEPAAVEAWLDRMRDSGLVSTRSSPSVRLERIDPGPAPRTAQAYAFDISATLAAPFAEEGARP